MLGWLKDPEKHFGPQHPEHPLCDGVCVGKFVEKTGLSQSTVSAYMDSLQRAGLVTARRRGQWTFYERNDETIADLVQSYSNRSAMTPIGC